LNLFWLETGFKLSFFESKHFSATKEVSLIHAFTLRLRGVKNITIRVGFETLQGASRFEPAM